MIRGFGTVRSFKSVEGCFAGELAFARPRAPVLVLEERGRGNPFLGKARRRFDRHRDRLAGASGLDPKYLFLTDQTVRVAAGPAHMGYDEALEEDYERPLVKMSKSKIIPLTDIPGSIAQKQPTKIGSRSFESIAYELQIRPMMISHVELGRLDACVEKSLIWTSRFSRKGNVVGLSWYDLPCVFGDSPMKSRSADISVFPSAGRSYSDCIGVSSARPRVGFPKEDCWAKAVHPHSLGDR